VLVDEGHDFEPEWLKLVAQMVHPESNPLLVLYDDAQSINRKKARLGFSFAEVGIQARGRTTILRLNYRNTAQIMALACEFARDLLSAKEAEEDAIPLVAPQSAGRSGARRRPRAGGAPSVSASTPALSQSSCACLAARMRFRMSSTLSARAR
jgi:superfamily I DNA/RNA helicase